MYAFHLTHYQMLLVISFSFRANVKLCKPIQVGLSILDLSKRHMYNWYYNVWLKHFPKTILLFTDTDSFCVAVEHPDVYGEMLKFKDSFDFSEYPKEHFLYDETNRKSCYKFKDEMNSLCITRFIGLRPKLYSFEYLTTSGMIQGKNAAKGVQKAVKKRLTFEDYEHSQQNMRSHIVTMNTIRSDRHHLYTYNIKKIGLSSFDDKRYILDDGISTLAHGHWRTNVGEVL